MAKKSNEGNTVDFLLYLAGEAVRLITGYGVIIVPLLLVPLAPISVITLLLYKSILADIPAWVGLVPLRFLICGAIAAGLEGFAVICLIVGSRVEEWNLNREPEEPELNSRVGWWALGAYIVLGMSMVIVGEILPHYQVFGSSAQIARWTLLGFFLLAPFGHWIFSTEAAIRRLEAGRVGREAQEKTRRENDLKLAEQQTILREREAAVREREAQAEVTASRARAAELEARAREKEAEANIVRQQAALTRAEARKLVPKSSGTISGTTDGADPGLPEWLPTIPASKDEFRRLCRTGVIRLPQELTGAELARYLPVGERQARNWIAYAQNGHGKEDS